MLCRLCYTRKLLNQFVLEHKFMTLTEVLAIIKKAIESGELDPSRPMAVCCAFHDSRDYYELKPDTFSIENYEYKNLIVLKY